MLSEAPANRSSTRWRLRISSRRTFRSSSAVCITRRPGPAWRGPGASGNAHLLQDPARHFLAIHALGLRLVGDVDAMAQHVEGDGLDVLRERVGAAGEQ